MILDTKGLSAVAEGKSGIEPVLRKATQVAIPVIVLGEYRYGISQSRNRKYYEQWLAEYLPTFRILDVDEVLLCRPRGVKASRNAHSFQ